MDEAWEAFGPYVAQSRIRLVPITDALVEEAASLTESLRSNVPLRTLDALHLASYMGVESWRLFTKDRSMLEAAALLDFPCSSQPHG
jgi:hypothetical protein